MGVTRIISLIILVLVSLSGYSQNERAALDSLESIDYIETFHNKITARLFMISTSNLLNVQSRQYNYSLELNPNKQNQIGASIAFRSIVISYSFAPNFLAENRDNKNSKLFNLNLRSYFGHWMQTIDLYQEKGFFIEGAGINLYLPQTKSFKIGGGTSYIFNKNFSFRAIVSQDEKQLKSAGSFIPRIIYYYSKFDVIADGINSDLQSFDFAVAPSYYYNYVPAKNLLLSAGASVGIGINYSRSDSETLTSLLTEMNLRGSFTYDKDNLYFGGHYSYLVLNHNVDRGSYVKDNIPYFQLFIGFRLNAPKSLVKSADNLNSKLKI